MDVLLVAGSPVPLLAAAAAEEQGLVINWFWIVVSSLNFLFFLFLISRLAIGPISRLLDERRARIEQGLRDADEARRLRESAADEHRRELAEARREAADILARAQKVAEESAAQLVATAREESDRVVERGRAEVAAERDRAIAEIRAEVADLAIRAAGRVVGESLDGKRQRALVEQFLAEVGPARDGSAEQS